MFLFIATATTDNYTLSLHDALPISPHQRNRRAPDSARELSRRSREPESEVDTTVGNLMDSDRAKLYTPIDDRLRSEEHTSELQSHVNLVCRLLLEKKNTSSHSVSID